MKAFIIIASCLGLFIIHAFKSAHEENAIARRSITSLDIISCGETNASSFTNFTWYDFTPGGDLMEKIPSMTTGNLQVNNVTGYFI